MSDKRPGTQFIHPVCMICLMTQVQASGGSGVPSIVARLPGDLPVISLGQHFSIFPGEEIQLRIFEKRYQWLMRQVVEQGRCFAIQSANGMATSVRVTRSV